MREEWKYIEGYEKRYMISSLGRVRSFTMKARMMKILIHDGYHQITLLLNKKSRTLKIHRLIAQAFIPNPENKPCINHKDGNKLNNEISNLEWCTYSENTQHAYDTNLIGSGLNHPKAKITEQQVIDVFTDTSISTRKAGIKYNVPKSLVWMIRAGK